MWPVSTSSWLRNFAGIFGISTTGTLPASDHLRPEAVERTCRFAVNRVPNHSKLLSSFTESRMEAACRIRGFEYFYYL